MSKNGKETSQAETLYGFKVKLYIDYCFFTKVHIIKYYVDGKDMNFLDVYNKVVNEIMLQLNGNAIRFTKKNGETVIFDRSTIKKIKIREIKTKGGYRLTSTYHTLEED